MKLQTTAGAAVAATCLLIAIASPGLTTANPHSTQARQHNRELRHPDDEPTPCGTNYPGGYSFTAISGAGELAGGDDSAVLGGNENSACQADSVVAGGSMNFVYDEGTPLPYSFIGGGYENQVEAPYVSIGSGLQNHILNDLSVYGPSDYSVIVGGSNNNSEEPMDFTGAGYGSLAAAPDSFIGSGTSRFTFGANAFVGAGDVTYAYGTSAFLGAGDDNYAHADDAFLGSGNGNLIAANAADSAIEGGNGNDVTGRYSTLGGGEANQVAGGFAVVPGGYRDEALGDNSFAAGSQAEARYDGSFVWSDYVSGEKALGDSAAGEFVARASGGVYFFSNAASSTGVHLAAGSGTWSSLSDRNSKTDIAPLDDASILAKVASLPVNGWRYTTERGVRHVGPMAQAFYAAFGVGEDARHITSIDEDGVALAAIKALQAQLTAQRDTTRALRAEVRRLRGEFAKPISR